MPTPASLPFATTEHDLPRTVPLGTVRDWIALLKPRVLTLVVFTGAVGLAVAPGHINAVLAFTVVLCITLGAGAAGAINMWYDRDIDAVMRRTRSRPVVTGAVAPDDALGFGVVLSFASVLILFLATNAVAATILAVSILFYVGVYTIWLKRRTPYNIVIGGAAGAFPPVIGWAAVTGSVSALPLLMFAIIFLWTPPHFWALSLYAHSDYARANVPMLPVTSGFQTTRRQILAYTVVLVLASLSPWLLGYTTAIYGLAALVLGLAFLLYAIRVFFDVQDESGRSLTNDIPAKAAFKYSLFYLFLLFCAFAVDQLGVQPAPL